MSMVELEAFLARTGIDGRTLEQWFAREWILPPSGARPALGEVDAARAVFIRELREDLGVNDEGVDVVLHLVDQLHGMRRTLIALRMEMRAPPE